MPFRKAIEPQFRDLPAFEYFIRKVFVPSPIFLIILLATPLFRLAHLLPQEFHALSLGADVALLVLREAAYLGLLFWLFPAILFRYLPRNVPYIVLHHGFFVILAIFSALILMPLHGDESAWQGLLRFGRHQVFSIFLTVVLMVYFDHSIQQHLGSGGKKIPVFWPVPQLAPLAADVVRLAPALSGDIIALHAQNQYVQVHSPAGTALLRMTLGEAINALPAQSGLRVHRSWWVSHRHMSVFSFDNKAMELQSAGLNIPVSRSRKDEIEQVFDQDLKTQPFLVDRAS